MTRTKLQMKILALYYEEEKSLSEIAMLVHRTIIEVAHVIKSYETEESK